MRTSSNDTAPDYPFDLPGDFVENVLGICGALGESWLRSLPQRIGEFETKWNLKVGPHFKNLSYNFVAPALTSDLSDVVLKLGLPAEDHEHYGEADYLRYLNGDGAVKLIYEDRKERALVLERAMPGEDLRSVFGRSYDEAVDVAARLLEKLVRRPPDSRDFIHLELWTGKLLGSEDADFPRDYIQRASDIFARTDKTCECLIHGDFHHENILSNGPDSFVVIDPKGVIGDIRYDIAVFLNNHWAWLRNEGNIRELLDRAVERFADAFGFSKISICEWAFAQKVLGAYWTSTEGRSRWRQQLASADIWDV